MRKGMQFKLRLGEWMLKHRWLLVILWGFQVLAIEVLEKEAKLGDITESIWWETLLYGLVFPAALGISLNLLASSRTEQIWLQYNQNLRRNLRQQLNLANDKYELATVLVQFFRVVMPIMGVEILLYDRTVGRQETIAKWFVDERVSRMIEPEGYAISDLLVKTIPQSCQLTLNETVQNDDSCVSCACFKPYASLIEGRGYCVNLYQSETSMALARLYFNSDNNPSEDHMRLLREIAPSNRSAFERLQLRQLIDRQNENLTAEQQRIARDVHDTLGHSLAYLRLKLDMISVEMDHGELETLRMEVKNVRDVAKEAFDQMRDVLIVLTPDQEANLNNLLLTYVDNIRQRAMYQIQARSRGQVRDLPPLVKKHVFMIFREALTNVDLHASASLVNVDVHWKENDLQIEITDDGKGFETARAIQNGHYGLKNMHERAHEIQASINLRSEIGQGTCFALQIPYGITA